jgi:biopolymer transport protein ExbD
MEARTKLVASVGIALILFGIIVPIGYARWLQTRTFVALDMSVSLSPGRINSAEFSVNLRGWYHIGTDVDRSFPFRTDCGFGGRPPLLKTRSTVYADGRVLTESDGADRYLGHFYAEPGRRYRFDLDVLTNASCLNAGHPRLIVWTASSLYDRVNDELPAASVVLFLFSLGILIFDFANHRQHRATQGEIAIPENGQPGWYPSRRQLPLKGRISRLPSFGLIYALLLLALLIPVFLIFLGTNPQSTGIEVHLMKLSPIIGQADFDQPPLVVRVESSRIGSPSHVYLNSKPVAWEALESELRNEFKSRPKWTVYVQAGDEVEWGDAVRAMDIIRGMGAKVILLTTEAPPRAQ